MPHSSLLNPALFMVQLSPQTDSFIIQPIFWVEILLQLSHSIHHPGAGSSQVRRFTCGSATRQGGGTKHLSLSVSEKQVPPQFWCFLVSSCTAPSPHFFPKLLFFFREELALFSFFCAESPLKFSCTLAGVCWAQRKIPCNPFLWLFGARPEQNGL